MELLILGGLVLAAFVVVNLFRTKASPTSDDVYIEGHSAADTDTSTWLDVSVLKSHMGWLEERWKRAVTVQESGVESGEFAPWYFEEVTDKQRRRLDKMGVAHRKLTLTKGQASDLIGLGEPAEEHDLAVMKFFKVSTKGANQTTARAEVARLFASQVNRERWKHRPATRESKECLRFLGEKVASGLLEKDAETLIADLFEQHPDKEEEWDSLVCIFDEFDDADFREDTEIKKPSRKVIQEAIDALQAQGQTLEDLAGDPEVVAEEITKAHPGLHREVR
jgi:hypothetical protein